MDSEFLVTSIEKSTIIEFRIAALMEQTVLESIGKRLYRLVDEEDHRLMILDFSRVEYLSSQAIGILINLHKKLSSLKNSKLVLCGINDKLAQLLKITRLDKVLTVKPTQKEAVLAMQKY
jgi:anti-sigma B factor antagonist